MLFHPIHSVSSLPREFPNPFGYAPHPLCLLAAHELQSHLGWCHEGKMFGVLVVEWGGHTGYLQAYSGQLESSVPPEMAGEFVPPVFDYLRPDGHFKQTEARIVDLGRQLSALLHSKAMAEARAQAESAASASRRRIETFRRQIADAKRRRDMLRAAGGLDVSALEALVRESQFQKAELRRRRAAEQVSVASASAPLRRLEQEAERLRTRRRELSDALQLWLFRQTMLLNGRGSRKNLLDIFSWYADWRRCHYGPQAPVSLSPPSGTGECCEPKLLHYAFSHAMRPVAMAMFWWGPSPAGEVRHHGRFYPACRGKCRPLLTWMLQGILVAPEPESESHATELHVVFEDDSLVVVNKPSGLLSVPGLGDRPSVASLMRRHCQGAEGPMVVHRLDQDTGGLMVLAKTTSAYHALQNQFLQHQVQKVYLAHLVPMSPSATPLPMHGRISLPLRPDLNDRPRQMVDHEHGLSAVTDYCFLSPDLVMLKPLTGRTHQLRVHCAHAEGLRRPIVGDRLYGFPHGSNGLCLHAFRLSFTHPVTGRRMTFEQWPQWAPADLHPHADGVSW